MGNTIKRIMAFILVICLTETTANITGINTVYADQGLSEAKDYSIGSIINDALSIDGAEKNFYKFYLPESGRIQVSGTANMEWVYIYMYSKNGEQIWRENPRWNDTTEMISFDMPVYLESGTYYFCVGRDGDRYGEYTFRLNFTSANETYAETPGGSNNSLSTASTINAFGKKINAQIANNDEKDFYRIDLEESGRVDMVATFNRIEYVYIKLYDKTGKELLTKNPRWNDTTERIDFEEKLYLTSGSFYISISKDGDRYGMYDFKLNYTSANENYKEQNPGSDNDINSANIIRLGETYRGQIAINDEKDFYKFTANKGKLDINLQAETEYIYIKLFDKNGNEIFSDNPRWNDTLKRISYNKSVVLNQGTYYLSISRDGNRYGNYSLSVCQKLSQSIILKNARRTISFKTIKKKQVQFNIGAKAKTKLSYKVTKGGKYLIVNSTGEVTVKEKTPRGTYKISIIATENMDYKKATKTMQVIVK